MNSFKGYDISEPIALKLIRKQVKLRGYISSTSDAFYTFLHHLKRVDDRIAIYVRDGDLTRGINLTVRLHGRKKVIMWIDLGKTIKCMIDRNEKNIRLFPFAKECNFHNNCGKDGASIKLDDSTWKNVLRSVLFAYDLKQPTSLASLTPIMSKEKLKSPNKKVDQIPRVDPKSSLSPDNVHLPKFEFPKIEDFEMLPGDPDYVAFEGKEYFIRHRAKERNKKIVVQKKIIALKNDPLLRCEICDFSFVEKYGKRGEWFAEVHHKMPLASLRESTKTILDDLAIVCSNCHRILHRKGHRTLEVDELKCILAEKKV